MARKEFTPEEFVVAWQSSASAAEVKRKLDTPASVHALAQRAWRYRRRGVSLKRMPKGRPVMDWEGLKGLAARVADTDTDTD